MERLEQVFRSAADVLMRRQSSASSHAAPFDAQPDSASTVELKTGINLQNLEFGSEETLAGLHVPEVFTSQIFDNAEKEITYLVLTNTWVKFVALNYYNSNNEN